MFACVGEGLILHIAASRRQNGARMACDAMKSGLRPHSPFDRSGLWLTGAPASTDVLLATPPCGELFHNTCLHDLHSKALAYWRAFGSKQRALLAWQALLVAPHFGRLKVRSTGPQGGPVVEEATIGQAVKGHMGLRWASARQKGAHQYLCSGKFRTSTFPREVCCRFGPVSRVF